MDLEQQSQSGAGDERTRGEIDFQRASGRGGQSLAYSGAGSLIERPGEPQAEAVGALVFINLEVFAHESGGSVKAVCRW